MRGTNLQLFNTRKPLVAALAALALAGCDQGEDIGTSEEHAALVSNFCVDCHNAVDYSGELDLAALKLDQIGAHQETWETAVNKLRGRLMPPAGAPQPAQEDIDTMVAYLEASIDNSADTLRVGHVPIQRLSRTEFATSMSGLIGIEVDPEQILPPEIEVEGFDNIANALSSSPAFLEQYISATRKTALEAIGTPVPKFAVNFYPFDGSNQNGHVAGFPLGTRGGMRITHNFPYDGEYHFNIMSIGAGAYPRGMEYPSTLLVLVDDVELTRIEIGGREDLELADRDGSAGNAAIIEKVSGIPARLTAGYHEITFTFIERSHVLDNDLNGGGRLANLPRIGEGIEIEGPYNPEGISMTESRQKILVCEPNAATEERACAERIARHFATRAFRRPVTDEDLEWLMPFYELGAAEEGGFNAGILELVTATLSSPDFLFRSIDAAPAGGEPRQLDDLELATRLAFFLWSQGPDRELIDLAANDELSRRGVLEEQVQRMLADERAEALIENFAIAWLNLDELEQVDPTQNFSAAMRTHFETEISLFLSSILLEDRSVNDLLTANHTYVNDALARQYGINGVRGEQFREVTLEDENRWGLLGKGAVLLRTSYGDRTSPVLRGAWILDRIMGTPPTPPPPDVVTDLSIKEGEPATTVRARLEEHRVNPNCQGCHGLIDPPGLALENFDQTGRWRDTDTAAREPIDASTVLSSGIEITGPVELRQHLLRRDDQFPMTITKRLMVYALNREIEYYDMPAVRSIVKAAAEDEYSFAALVTGIVNSDAFRYQGSAEPATESVAASIQ